VQGFENFKRMESIRNDAFYRSADMLEVSQSEEAGEALF
jgi:hypothetical protein